VTASIPAALVRAWWLEFEAAFRRHVEGWNRNRSSTDLAVAIDPTSDPDLLTASTVGAMITLRLHSVVIAVSITSALDPGAKSDPLWFSYEGNTLVAQLGEDVFEHPEAAAVHIVALLIGSTASAHDDEGPEE